MVADEVGLDENASDSSLSETDALLRDVWWDTVARYDALESISAWEDQRRWAMPVIDEADLGLDWGEGPSVRDSLLVKDEQTMADTPHLVGAQVEDRTPPEEWDQDLLDAIKERFQSQGFVGPCGRGPYQHYARAGANAATSHRLSCCSYRCTFCGERVMNALRAALYEYLYRNHPTPAWSHGLVETARRDGSHEKAVRRWRAKSKSDRFYLSIGINPTSKVWLLIWKTEGDNAPRNALGKRTEVQQATDGTDIAKTADELASRVDLLEWKHEQSTTRVLGGDTDSRGQISKLRDFALGRRRAIGMKKPVDVTAIRTYTSTLKVHEAIEERFPVKVKFDAPVTCSRNRSEMKAWTIERPADLHESQRYDEPKLLLDSLNAQGFFKPMQPRTKKLSGMRHTGKQDGYYTLVLP